MPSRGEGPRCLHSLCKATQHTGQRTAAPTGVYTLPTQGPLALAADGLPIHRSHAGRTSNGCCPGKACEERTRRLSALEGYWKNRRVAGTLLPLQLSPSDNLPPTWSTTLTLTMRHSQGPRTGGQSGRAHGSLEYSMGGLSDGGLMFQPRAFWAAWGPTSFRAEAEPVFTSHMRTLPQQGTD